VPLLNKRSASEDVVVPNPELSGNRVRIGRPPPLVRRWGI
jgi:hypothetical protein